MLIYLARNTVNGKCYVGKTVDTLEARWYAHVWEANHRSNLVFHKAIRKHGPQAFDVTVVCYADNHDQLYNLEQATIAAFRTIGTELYNCTDGGPGSYGLHHSQDTRAKQRAAKLGKKQLSEQVAKRAAANRKPHKSPPPITPEHRAKLSAANRGNPKCIMSHLGKKHTSESRAKLSAAMKGRKVSTGMLGKRHSPETILKMKLARKLRTNPPVDLKPVA